MKYLKTLEKYWTKKATVLFLFRIYFFPRYDKGDGNSSFQIRSYEIEKKKFHSFKNPVGIYDGDIKKIIMSDVSAYGKNFKKYALFTRIKKIRSFFIKSSQMIGRVNSLRETKYISVEIKGNELFEKI